MVQYTTPQLTLTLPDTIDLTTMAEIYVSVRQGSTRLIKTLDDAGVSLSGTHTIRATLTQEDTMQLDANEPAYVMVNLITAGKKRIATKRKQIMIYPNDIDEVIDI